MAGWDYPRRKRLLDARGVPSHRGFCRRGGDERRRACGPRAVRGVGGAPGRAEPMTDRQLESTTRASDYQKILVRPAPPGGLRPTSTVRDSPGRHAVRAVRGDGRAGRQQSMVGGARCRQTPLARLPGRPERARLPRGAVPLLQPVDGLHARSGRRGAALGRAAEAGADLRASDLRLYPARLRRLGGGVRHRVHSHR